MIRSLGLDSKAMQVGVTIGVQRPDKVDAAAVKAGARSWEFAAYGTSTSRKTVTLLLTPEALSLLVARMTP